ncbi:hypothetical protein [Xanthomarina gelatinilytica]|uniref:hypothetical protein n=2 Tax=Xanthomarina gelatinilytica TaxID=1137281 RepID=UPI003AA9A848
MQTPVRSSFLSSKIMKHIALKIGDFYFFENFVLVEYAKEAIISMRALHEIKTKGLGQFANNKPFGLIVNKIHPFNTVPTDAMQLEKEIPNLVATAVVSEDLTKSVNFDLENHFLKKINRRLFSSLEEAEAWINEKVEAKKNSYTK